MQKDKYFKNSTLRWYKQCRVYCAHDWVFGTMWIQQIVVVCLSILGFDFPFFAFYHMDTKQQKNIN